MMNLRVRRDKRKYLVVKLSDKEFNQHIERLKYPFTILDGESDNKYLLITNAIAVEMSKRQLDKLTTIMKDNKNENIRAI